MLNRRASPPAAMPPDGSFVLDVLQGRDTDFLAATITRWYVSRPPTSRDVVYPGVVRLLRPPPTGW
jgi:hypothetical protein